MAINVIFPKILNMKFTRRYLTLLLVSIAFASCKVNQSAQEIDYTQFQEMQLDLDNNTQFENYIYKIREGALPVHSKKSGGCGCN